MELQFDKCKYNIDSEGFWLSLRVKNNNQAKEFIQNMQDKLHVAILKVFRNKRSLDSNAYAWKLITEIGNVLRADKEEIYLRMLKRYGQSDLVSVKSFVEAKCYFKYFEEVGKSTLNGIEFTHYKVYKGSSEFDSREMSILIDGIVSECKELGIETLTPNEIERMKGEWGK